MALMTLHTRTTVFLVNCERKMSCRYSCGGELLVSAVVLRAMFFNSRSIHNGATSMVRWPIGPMTHWSDDPLVRKPIIEQ